ncbi:transposase [Streptomyces sp. NPDC020298]|uniref:transposase n=1 Tax=unclassified Streptomyces TaxID=2593676 RepID=UPI0033EF46CE
MFIQPDDHGLGRSRGGLTTKLHLAVEQAQQPMSLAITAGQRGDSPQFQVVLGRTRVPRLGPARPCSRPDRVRADKAYGSRAHRAYLRERGVRCTIPEKRDQITSRKKRSSRGGRPPKFDAAEASRIRGRREAYRIDRALRGEVAVHRSWECVGW